MATEEKDQDQTEKATPSKLREARKQGQVAKSPELTAWIIMLGVAAFFYSAGTRLIEQGLHLNAALIDQSGDVQLSVYRALYIYNATSAQLAATLWPLAAVVLSLALLANFLQIGAVFSWTPLQPDFKRLNPATGFKRLFNKKILVELVKTLLKIALLVGVLSLFIREHFNTLVGLLYTDIAVQPAKILDAVLTLSFWMLGAMAIIALLDFCFQKWDYAKNLRMSRRDIKDEVKRQDGDPLIKAKIRELQREAAQRGGSISRIPDADVLITNPTHLSVAIQYRQGHMAAPIVLAKGAGELALKMRMLAGQHQVPIVEDKALARLLFKRVAIDEIILPECYARIAAILTRVYQYRGRQ